MKYDNTLKGDISIGFSNQSFNNNMSFNSINIGYSKTIKITDNFWMTPGIQFNFYSENGQPPYFHNFFQPLPDRAIIR